MTTIAREKKSAKTLQRDRVSDSPVVVGGVDTHRDTHTAAALDGAGRLLGHGTFAATAAGYRALLAWLRSFGTVTLVGVEGTGSYGSGLAVFLAGRGVAMVEVDRPDRRTRRRVGKSDPIDAEAAARTALAGDRAGIPKTRDSQVEALRNLRVVRRSAVDQRADTQRQIRSLIVTAPETLRARLRDLPDRDLLQVCAGLRPDPARTGDPEQAVKTALRSLARRHQRLSEEIDDLEALILPLVTAINPALLAVPGVGPEVAGQLLVTVGANPERLHSEAAFAMLCGVAPIPASSGQTHRHRLNRGGDRQANRALHIIAIARLQHDPRTQAYKARRTDQKHQNKDIMRCLKRFIARELYPLLRPSDPPKITARQT